MCFSAEASFTAAVGLALAGGFCLGFAGKPQERMLAAFPLLFAVQQTVEGAIWLELSESPGAVSGGAGGLAELFLAFAYVIWPIITAPAVWLIEPGRNRRRVMAAFGALGAAVAALLAYALATQDYLAAVRGGHIAYLAGIDHPIIVELAYAAAVTAPLAASSHRSVQVFAAVVAAGAAVSYFGFAAGRPSVWCFFAAAASAILIWRYRPQPALA